MLSLTVLLTTVVAAIALFLIPTFLMLIAIKDRRQLTRFLIYFSWVIPLAAIGLAASSRYSDLRAWLTAPSIAGFRDAPIWISTSDAFGLYGATAFALALLALAVTTKWGSQLLLAIALGIVAIWVGSQGSMSFWTGRTFIIFLPILAVAAAAVLANATWVRAFGLFVILGVAAQPSHAYLREPGNRGPEWSKVAELVAQQSQPGDQTNDRLLFLALHHYQPEAKVSLTESASGEGIWTSANSACSGQPQQVITSDGTYMICR